MCGIVGIYNFSKHIDENLLIRMRDTMSHRGPDDSGLYISRDGKVGLGHRRLSILDLSSAGKQPMRDSSENFWITYNGEVYNFMELRQELEEKGHKFQNHTDTEVIIYLYKEYGKNFLHKLRGMFAFGIWDENKRELFLARDRIGIKPLYYTSCNGQFIFASEIKAILEHPDVKREVDMDAFYHYLTFVAVPAPSTLFEGINKLPAGHTLTVDEKGSIKVEEYWDVFDNVKPISNMPESFYTDSILSILKDSVRYRMVSDVPVGIFLSGGVDSSTNTALFSELAKEPVKTFSIGYKGQESYNEFQYARKVAELFHTDHHEVTIGIDDLIDFLPDLVFYQDEPIADSVCVPIYFVSKLARDNGVIVCQVGEGSDELFCGYPHWKRILRFNDQIVPYLKFVPSIVRKMGLGLMQIAGKGQTSKYETFRRAHQNESVFWGGVIAFTESGKRHILSKKLNEYYTGKTSYEVVKHYYDIFMERSPIKDYLHFMSYLDLKFRLPELLLMRVDKMSMATSLEARVPFLDHKFVEFAMSIIQDVKVKNNELKYILKKSVESLIPHEIIYREKQGFRVPVTEWLMEKLGDYTKKKIMDFVNKTEFFDRQSIEALLNRKNSDLSWYILNFVLWHELWIQNDASIRQNKR